MNSVTLRFEWDALRCSHGGIIIIEDTFVKALFEHALWGQDLPIEPHKNCLGLFAVFSENIVNIVTFVFNIFREGCGTFEDHV